MVELDQIKFTLGTYRAPLKELAGSLDLVNKKEKIEEIENIMNEPGFWDNADKSQAHVKELNTLKNIVAEYKELETEFNDVEVYLEMGYEANDPEMIPEVQGALDTFVEHFEKVRLATLLSGQYDKNDVIINLHAGAGGTESCDWCSMLTRMYTRYAEKHGMQVSMIDFLDGDEAGYKSVTLEIRGENAYGYLKSEHGVHRLVRISPFNAAGKRQTSFVSLDVMPDIDDDIDIEIDEKDIRIDTYHSSGAGGQHVNKTSSAIRITHYPTGIVVQCQNERSQFQNKDKAMQMLKTKLYLMKQAENEANVAGIRGEVRDINFGSQIRSYVLQPYTMVKDHRTGVSVGNADAVLDGGLDPFINGYLKWFANGCQKVEGADAD